MTKRTLWSVALACAAQAASAGQVVHYDFETIPVHAEKRGEVQLVPGLSGQALKVGDEGTGFSALRFPNDGIFAPDREVSVGFWVSPLDWNGDYRGFLFLFRACQDDNTGLRLYKYVGSGGFLWFLAAERPEGGGETAMQYVHARIGGWKAGEWHHLVITYRPGGKTFIGKECRQQIFLDGKLVGTKSVPENVQPTRFPADYFIGPSERWQEAPSWHGAIDEFKIWDHELSPAEVRSEFLKLYRGTGDAAAEMSAGLLPKGAAFDEAFERCAAGSNAFCDRRGLLQQRIAAPQVRVAATPDELLVRIREDVRALKLKADARQRDGEVYFDDAYEVLVQTGERPLRHYIVNSRGTVYDGKGMDGGWNGKAKIASAVRDGVWEIRLRIPAGDLELDGFKEGDDIRLGIGRDLMALGQREYVANCGICGYFFNVKRYPHVRLAEAGARGTQADVEFVQPNVVRLAASLPVAWEYADNGTNAVRSANTSWRQELPMTESSVRYDGCLRSADGRLSLPLSVLREPSLIVNGELDPESGRMTVSVRLADEALKDRVSGGTVRLSMAGEAIGEYPYAEKIVIPKAKLPRRSGDIDVEIVSRKLIRPLVGRWNYYFVDSDRWIDYDGGLDDDDVPSPWTPIESRKGSLLCLNREYRLGARFLPESIREKGEEILSAPVRLRATVDGKRTDFAAVRLRTVRSWRGRTDLAGEGTIAGCRLAVRVTFEFDGFYWVECDIDRKGHAIEDLVVEVPFNADNSQLKFVPFLNEKAVQRDDVGGVLPEQHWGFGPGIWVGGDRRGVTLFTESDEHLYLRDASRCYSLTKDGALATLRFNLIDRADGVPEKLHYGFGLQATPVKPFPQPKDWMHYGFVRAPNNRIYITGWGNTVGGNYQGMPGFDGCAKAGETMAGAKRQAAQLADGKSDYGVPVMPIRYLCPNMVASTLPELDVFRRSWEVLPSDVWGTDGPDSVPFVRVSPMARSWANFYCWRFDRYFAETRESGVYQDFAHPIRDCNPLHGAGYERDGRRGTTYAIVSHREINKRLYRIAKKYETPGRPIFFIGHSGGSFVLPHGNFWQLTNDGEYLGGVVNEQKPYSAFMTPGRVRAEFNGRPFGILFNFIPIQGKGKAYTEDMFAYVVPAGVTWMHHALINDEVQRRVWRAYAEFGLDDVAAFHPFWDKGNFFSADADEGVMVSVLEKPGLLLVACGNPTGEVQPVRLKFSVPVSACKPEGGDWRPVTDGASVEFSVRPRNFTYLILKSPRHEGRMPVKSKEIGKKGLE